MSKVLKKVCHSCAKRKKAFLWKCVKCGKQTCEHFCRKVDYTEGTAICTKCMMPH